MRRALEEGVEEEEAEAEAVDEERRLVLVQRRQIVEAPQTFQRRRRTIRIQLAEARRLRIRQSRRGRCRRRRNRILATKQTLQRERRK